MVPDTNMYIVLHGFSTFQMLLNLTSCIYVHKWLASSNFFLVGFFSYYEHVLFI